MKDKLKKLKEMASAARTGGISGAMANSDDEKVNRLKEARNNAMRDAGFRVARAMGKATVDKDARQERQIGSKYKDVSPIMAKGVFTSATDKKQDSNLTQAELDRKKRK